MTEFELRHGWAHTNGIRMHYVEQGKGPMVLLCHGWPESWYSWRHQITALAAAGFRVVAPDQRGYGETDAPDEVETYDILNLIADVVGLVQSLGEDRAFIVGHDVGSGVAQSAALLRPDMFRALGLLSVPYLSRQKLRPSVRFDIATQEKHFYQHYFQPRGHVERELEEDVARSISGILYMASGEARAASAESSFVYFKKGTRLIDNLVLPDRLPPWLSQADLDHFVAQFERSGFRGPINWYRNFDRNWELTPFLDGAKILQPTIFATGSLDGVLKMFPAEYAALEINVPRLAGKHLIPGAGHWVQQERPTEINELLIGFLKEQIESGALV
jgi:pimeloyl-ACP methyl ester carboxylesterase